MNATQMWKRVRSAVYGRTEDDVDIVDCHQCIAAALSGLVGLDPSSVITVLAYTKDRNAELAKQQLAREDAKTLVVACLNGLNIHRLERSDSAAIKEFIAKNPDWPGAVRVVDGTSFGMRSAEEQTRPVAQGSRGAQIHGRRCQRQQHGRDGDDVKCTSKPSTCMLAAKAELESRGVAWTMYA